MYVLHTSCVYQTLRAMCNGPVKAPFQDAYHTEDHVTHADHTDSNTTLPAITCSLCPIPVAQLMLLNHSVSRLPCSFTSFWCSVVDPFVTYYSIPPVSFSGACKPPINRSFASFGNHCTLRPNGLTGERSHYVTEFRQSSFQ